MRADVQSWLDDPASNFGWLVLGDESEIPTAKRFDTRESASPPVLTIHIQARRAEAYADAESASDSPASTDAALVCSTAREID